MIAVAFATVYVVWGSTYFFIQKALVGLHPFLLGSMRFLASGTIMMLWCVIRKEKIWSVQAIKMAAITGIMLLSVGNGIVIWVEQFMPSAVVAITVSAAPIWFVLLDKPHWKENFSDRSTIIGLIVGFMGVLLLFGQQLIGSLDQIDSRTIIGLALLIIGSMSWAGGSLYAKAHPTGASATVNTAWQMLIGGLAFVPGIFITGEWERTDWAAVPTASWLSILYLILMGSIAAYSAYVWLLQVRPATQVSTYAYVNPVIAVILGVAFANEHISTLQIAGLGVILLSVLLINLNKYRKAA
ncbi:EamA family transporter [Mucilaginibacter myungsuensis]|uniref:EamA family transporter n=1 Tax=Mucilaginibacter myungsuensis TaxID=649104 RepID=A0A929KV60_9SPHI|nr:EamA family transporter [Mucilaginibacter myungsuensis]MBE9661018.1 EamA family transporter [Mucilaginibacter myungsuensis]MDN3597162.1 EamA family transporter [Mucilaginibacter myungsuensis]